MIQFLDYAFSELVHHLMAAGFRVNHYFDFYKFCKVDELFCGWFH